MLHSSYQPPAGAGMQARIHEHIHMQTHGCPRWVIAALTPKTPWRQIYAHMEGPSPGSGDQAYSKLLRSFQQPDDSLPACTPPLPPSLPPLIAIH